MWLIWPIVSMPVVTPWELGSVQPCGETVGSVKACGVMRYFFFSPVDWFEHAGSS